MTTQNVEYSFFFRAEKVKDESGKEIGEPKKLPAFKTNLPIPSAEDLMGYLAVADSAEAKLIVELIGESIYQVARAQINDWREVNKDATEVSPAALALDKLDFSVIANTPRETVGRAGVSEEAWTSFYEAYAQVMLAAGELSNRVQTQVTAITAKFKSIKDVKVLNRMMDKLNMFAASAGEDLLAEHARAYLMTVNRLEAAIKKSSEVSLDDIG